MTHGRIVGSAERNVRFWPISEVAARLVEVRSVRHSGLDLLAWSSSHFDPTQTSNDVDGLT
jgi:hypothetical protein